MRRSRDGRIGPRLAEMFDRQRLGRAPRAAARDLVMPDDLRSELQPDSPWAARRDRLTIGDAKRRS